MEVLITVSPPTVAWLCNEMASAFPRAVAPAGIDFHQRQRRMVRPWSTGRAEEMEGRGLGPGRPLALTGYTIKRLPGNSRYLFKAYHRPVQPARQITGLLRICFMTITSARLCLSSGTFIAQGKW